MKIETKEQMYRLLQEEQFGNRLRTWASLEEVRASGYRGPLSVRYMEPGSSFCRYDISFADAGNVLADLLLARADLSKIVLGEMAPDGDLILQGEVMRSPRHYELTYTTVPKPMRLALKEWRGYAWGLSAVSLLKTAMCPSSYEDLQAIWDRFPDSTVEFSCYRRTLGSVKGRNTVIWECRDY